VSTSAETVRPGVAWNATRAAGTLMVVIIAMIALVFWPSFEASGPAPAAERQANALAAPHRSIVVDGEVCVQCLP
jgi:hypothetical protein